MTLSLSWLLEYLKVNMTPEQISDALTSLGLEVEKMETRESIKGGLTGVVAGKVLTCVKHPDADRLSITTVDVGGERPSSIVCGAHNIASGQMVWVALPDTVLYDAAGQPWTIKVSKIRGQLSEGMICAEDELGLGPDHDGIIVLPEDVPIGTRASNYYQITTDTLFEIGLTPNRSDATSVIGVADDLAAFLSVQQDMYHHVIWPSIPEIPLPTTSKPFSITVKNNIACPRYSGVLIGGLKIGPSPEWIRNRLQAIGVKSINNVVDITNFVLHEMGQPLHAFDAGKISGDEIIVETKPAGTPFLALDQQSYVLHEQDLMICDGTGQPMCIGGVYGGLNSGVTEMTDTIFLESAHFNASWIRRSSMRHNLRTDAARRFEKGTDPNLTLAALARAVDLLTTYAGGTVISQVFDHYPVPVQRPQILLRRQVLAEKTGVDFTRDQVERILEALNMTYSSTGEDGWTVSVPTNKADVLREIDVIEEIIRVYGIDRIPVPARMQAAIAVESRWSAHRMRRMLGQYLVSNGYCEMMNMSMTQPMFYQDFEWMDPAQYVTIHNTSNESLNLLRPEMIVPVLETIRRNINRRQESLRLFEFGKSYRQIKEMPEETEHLVLAMTGHARDAGWQTGEAINSDFFSIKAVVHAVLGRLGISNYKEVVLMDVSEWAYGLEYTVGPLTLVRFGKVATQVCHRMDIRQDVFVADFMLDTLIGIASRSVTIYEELNRYPAVERDLAIVVADTTAFKTVRHIVEEAGAPWLMRMDVFDLYKNPDHLGAGKMSIALRFTIENKEATLSDKEIDQWFSRMQRALISGVGAEIRR